MSMTAAAPYSIPPEPGRARAIALATLVHVLLFAFLWIGVRWQNETPVSVEAEIWSPQAREAAPRPEPAEVAPAPQPAPRAAVETPEEAAPDARPDIALEQIRKRKTEQLKLQREAAQQEKLVRQTDEKRLEKIQEEKAKQLLARENREQIQAQEHAQKQAQEQTDLKKALALKKRQQEDADSRKLAKIRDDEMRRITGAAPGSVVGSGGTGSATKSQGGRADNGYVQRVGAKIKSNSVFNVPENLDGNPNVEYDVQLLPDGSLRGRPRKLKSSGVPGFDEAILNAIEKSVPFPADKTGTAPAGFTLSNRPKD